MFAFVSARAALSRCIRGHEDALFGAVEVGDLDAADAAQAAIDELAPMRDAFVEVLDAHQIEEMLGQLAKRRDFLLKQMQELARLAVETNTRGDKKGECGACTRPPSALGGLSARARLTPSPALLSSGPSPRRELQARSCCSSTEGPTQRRSTSCRA